jgi:Uma2 family endonuclease
MTSPLPTRPVILTYDDYRHLPDDGRRYEILEGELHVTPAPTVFHQRISRNLGFILHSYVRSNKLGEVYFAPIDVILDRTSVVQPDLLFVSRTREAMIAQRGIEGAPDLMVEILSPHTEERDRGAKLQLYARYGVQHYWILDPDARAISEYVLQDRDYGLRGTHVAPAHFTSALFPDLAVDLGEVFG